MAGFCASSAPTVYVVRSVTSEHLTGTETGTPIEPGSVVGGPWVVQMTAPSAETLVILNHALRFSNGECWGGVKTRHAPDLAMLYR
jgi:hypothetical protein